MPTALALNGRLRAAGREVRAERVAPRDVVATVTASGNADRDTHAVGTVLAVELVGEPGRRALQPRRKVDISADVPGRVIHSAAQPRLPIIVRKNGL